MPLRTGSHVVHNIETSQISIYLDFIEAWDPLGVHVMSFMDSIPNNGCMIQPPTHELGRNVGTPVPSDIVLERFISKEVT